MEIQDGSVSYVHSTGALICVFASFLAAVVSYLALRSRGRSNRRGINHGCGSTSAPLSKACHQLGPLQGDRTKEWMYSTCTECSHSEEVSSDAHGADQSASTESDLEIQHTLGSLAIGHTDAPQSRDSPRSWLHLIEDLDLLPDQASNQTNSPHEANNKRLGNKSAADFNISQPSPNSTLTASNLEKSNMAAGCPRKPLIQPAKLRVRKRRFSISSATAALSLTGNGWGFGDHVINKTSASGHSVNGEAPNPFLQVPDTRCMNIRRNSVVVERPRVNYFQQGRTNDYSSAHFANGNGLMNHNHNISLQDSRRTFSRLDSHTTPPPNNQPWQQSSSSSSSSLISSSHLPCPSNQPQSTGTPAAATNDRPRSNGVRCVVVALVLLSVTGNVVLLLLLIVYVYKPSKAASPVWADVFSNL